MREIRQSGSGGGATFNPSLLPHPVRGLSFGYGFAPFGRSHEMRSAG